MSGNSPDEDYSSPAGPHNNNNPNTEDVNNISPGNNNNPNNNNNNPVSNNPLSDAIRTTTTGSNNNTFETPEGNQNTPNYPPAVTNSRVAGGENDEMSQGGGLVIGSSTSSSASRGWSKVFILLSILLNIISVGVGIYFFTRGGGGGGVSGGGGSGGGGSTVGLDVYWDDTSGSGQGPGIGGGLGEDVTGHGNVENFEGMGPGAPEGVKSLLGDEGEGGGEGNSDLVVGGISINGGGGGGAEEDLGEEGLAKWGNTITKGDLAVGGGGRGDGGGGGGGEQWSFCGDGSNDDSCKSDESSTVDDGRTITSSEDEDGEEKNCQLLPLSKRKVKTSHPNYKAVREEFVEASRSHSADAVVRGIIAKYKEPIVGIIQQQYCLRKPDSHYRSTKHHFLIPPQNDEKDILACDMTREEFGLVYLLDPPRQYQHKKKIGSTKQPQGRCAEYAKEEATKDFFKVEHFKIIFRMKCLSKESLVNLYKIVLSIIDDILRHEEVPEHQKRFYKSILDPPVRRASTDSSSTVTTDSSSTETTAESSFDSFDDNSEFIVDTNFRQWWRAGLKSTLTLQVVEYVLQIHFELVRFLSSRPHSAFSLVTNPSLLTNSSL